MKTKFVRFLANCAINGHSLELRERDDNSFVVRHERYGKHSGNALSFRDQEHLQSWIDSKQAEGAALLNQLLGDVGAAGFPAK